MWDLAMINLPRLWALGIKILMWTFQKIPILVQYTFDYFLCTNARNVCDFTMYLYSLREFPHIERKLPCASGKTTDSLIVLSFEAKLPVVRKNLYKLSTTNNKVTDVGRVITTLFTGSW